MMFVVILLVFTIPLVCWALLARSARSGERVGAVLACCVLLEIAAAKQWLFGEVRVTLITTLSVLTMVILVWGAVYKDRRGAPEMSLSGRRVAGVTLTSIYCVVCSLVCFDAVTSGGGSMPARAAQPSSVVLPLGPGMAVVSDTASCTGQAGNSCLREIALRDTLGRSPQQFTDAILSGLERQHGWRFSDGTACRPDGGWALDRQSSCVSLDDLTEAPLVVVDVETDNGTGMFLSGLMS
jgi:hypothetical protein